MANLFKKIRTGVQVVHRRATAKKLPLQEEIEEFGAYGEDVIYRMLRKEFDAVIRGAAIPFKDKYLEKDFLVIHRGVPVVIEVKNWKGTVGFDESRNEFYQDKENGVHKRLKSPVDSTNRFIDEMKKFYSIERTVAGIVIFAEPDCVLDLPKALNGISLVAAAKAIPAIKSLVREHARESKEPLPDMILHCSRIYSSDSEFCKGLLATHQIPCFAEDGSAVLLNTDYLRSMKVESQRLLLRDKLSVTYTNGATDVFYNRDSVLSLCCLDGTCQKIALNKVTYVLF